MNRLKQGLIGLSFLFFFFPAVSQAGGEPQSWETLPQIENILFSKDAVGFIASDKRYFVFDRGSKEFHQVDESRMKETFPGPAPLSPSEVIQNNGIGSTVLLRTSGGKAYRTTNAYCDEGEESYHDLSLDDIALEDAVLPCVSISAIEKVGDQLWLGTRYDGEGGESPAEGIIVQAAKKGTLIKKIGSEQGLTGDLIRVIRSDPFGPTVWVATQWGLNQLDRNLNIVQSGFFDEDFDPATGRSTVFLSPVLKESNPFVVLQRQLEIRETKNFYEAVKKIPPEVEREVSVYLHSDVEYSIHERNVEKLFVPKEINVLLPFFLKSIRSDYPPAREVAISMACIFNDPAVLHAYLALEREALEGSTGPVPFFVKKCLDKYSKLGLMKGSQEGGPTALPAHPLGLEEAFLNASKGNRTDLLARLIERGISLEAIDADGMTGLMWAAKAGAFEAAQNLVGKGANVNARNSRGETALIQATKGGHAKIVKLLLDAGADPTGKDHGDLSPGYYAVFSDYPLIARLIKEGAACCGTLEEVGRQEEQERRDLAEVVKFDPIDWDALQKGCRPRKEYASNIPLLVERQPGHAGLEIVIAPSNEKCPPENGCRFFTKLEFEKLFSRRIKATDASTRFAIRPCRTKKDLQVLVREAEIEAIQRSQYQQDPLLRKRSEKMEGEWCSRSTIGRYPVEIRIQFVNENGLVIGRGTSVTMIGTDGSQASAGGVRYFSLIPIRRALYDSIEVAYIHRFENAPPDPMITVHVGKTERGLKFDYMTQETLTPSCGGFWKESPS